MAQANKTVLETQLYKLGAKWLLKAGLLLLLFSCVRLFVTQWTRARQALLSSTASRSLVRLMLVASRTLSNHLVLCRPLLLLLFSRSVVSDSS